MVDGETGVKDSGPPDPINKQPDSKYVAGLFLQHKQPIDQFRVILNDGRDGREEVTVPKSPLDDIFGLQHGPQSLPILLAMHH